MISIILVGPISSRGATLEDLSFECAKENTLGDLGRARLAVSFLEMHFFGLLGARELVATLFSRVEGQDTRHIAADRQIGLVRHLTRSADSRTLCLVQGSGVSKRQLCGSSPEAVTGPQPRQQQGLVVILGCAFIFNNLFVLIIN